ncbi:MAG: penicillin acylase family protein, partial [Ideonella sp.]
MHQSDPSPARPLHGTDAAFDGASLEQAVTLHRDQWGIPHILARSDHDAFFAQGYVHAQDRLWQMDSSRLRMAGRWAESAGPSAVAGDALARRLGGESTSQRDYAALGEPARQMVQAYSDGVNAFLAEGRELPIEYQLLGTRPEAWEPWHCIATMRWRGFLMGSLWFKLWRAAALRVVDPELVATLRYDDGGEDLLCIPPGAEAQRWIATLQDLAPAIEALAELGALDATGGGSNNWAVAPTRSASGRPLLAGDPHRAFEMPGMYVQNHVAGASFDAIGFAIPGVPGFAHFAHNAHVAWCVTHAFADIHDLFVEQFEADGTRHRTPDGWQDCQRRSETLQVRGAEPVTIDIVETRHGPVIAGTPASGSALVLQSVQFAQTDHSFDCLPRMLSARSVDELFDSTRGWGLIDHNLVAADSNGQIGHLVRAVIPNRSRLNGWLPVPGWTGEHDW